MYLIHADNTYSNNNELLLNPTDIKIQPGKQPVIYLKSQVYTEIEVKGLLKASPDLEDNNDLIICLALKTTQNRQFTVLINNSLEPPYILK